jgi:hypothetical protein
MITFRSPDLPLDGQIQWHRENLDHVPGQSLDVYLGVGPELLERVVINGAVIELEDIALCTPNDGDEITVIPKVGSSAKSIIVGVLGAIVGIALIYITAGAATPAVLAILQGAMAGYSVATLVYSLAHPARVKAGDKTHNANTFEGITNEDRTGVAQPVVLGDDYTGGVRVDSFVRIGMFPDPDNAGQTKKGTRSYQLIDVSKSRWGIGGISGVTVNAEPIANFPSASWAYSLGETPDQWYDGPTGNPINRPEAFNVSANTFVQTQELTSTPYIYTTSTSSLLTDIELLIALPAGLVHTHKGTDSSNWTSYRVRYKLHSSGTWINCAADGFDAPSGVRIITDKTHAAITEPVRLANLTPGRYDVELTWQASHFNSISGDDIDTWKVFLVGVTEEISNAPATPGYAKLAVSALAVEQLNGAPPTIGCRCKGIKVPWWNGTSWQAPTWDGPDATKPKGRNTAWLVLEILRDRDDASVGYERWGVGLDDTQTYLPLWKAWADACDTSVTYTDDQGQTFTEPMHQLDTTLNSQRPYDSLIRDLMATARAAPMRAGNGAQHGVYYDKADDAVQLVTQGNMVEGSFQPIYDYSPRKNTFDVTFRDRAHDFASVTRTIVNDHLVTTLGKPIDRESLSLEGDTRWSSVKRTADYNLKKHEAAKVPLQFEMSTDAILWSVGQVVNVQHEQPGWGIKGGVLRLATHTTTQITLPIKAHVTGGSTFVVDLDGTDILVDLAHLSYEVRVRLADGSGEEGQQRIVSSVAVSSDGYLIVNTTTPFSSVPQFKDPCAFGVIAKSVKPYRCLAISLSAMARRKITCIDYNASVFAPGTPLETINYSSLPLYGGPPPPIPPASAIAREDLAAQNTNVALSTVIIQWATPIRVAGFGFYGGADVEASQDGGVTYALLPGRAHGTEYRWTAAPHEIPLVFRITPVSTAGRPNLVDRAITSSITCHGSQAIPANVSGLLATVEGDSFVWRWNDVSREMQFEGRDLNSGFGTADSHRVFIGRMTEYKINAPSTRSKTIFIKAFQPMASAGTSTPIYSAAAVSATATKAAPAPPTIGTRITNSDTIKIPVGAASDPGVTGIRLWASQTNGFTPSAGTQAAQIVPSSGGDFIFHVTTPGTWYFRVAAADALTDRLADYSYSSQFTSAIVVITPQSPTAVTFAENGTAQRRRAASSPASTPPMLTKVFSLFLNWSFADSVNPAGSHIGFYVEIYQSGADPEVPYLSTTIADAAARSWPISDITFEASATWIGAVKALYVDGGESSLITSTGLALNPATGDDVLAQLKLDSHGGYYSIDTLRIPDAAGNVVTIDKNGVWTTGPDGIQRAPRRVSHAVLRGATSGQFVSWTDANLDPPLMPNFFGVPASKLHVVAQMRTGPSVDALPTNYPSRLICEATEIAGSGFRLSLSQCDGGVSQVLQAAADNSGNWTVNGSADGAATAIHGSPMLLTPSPNPTDTAGRAAWYDPLAINNGWPIVIRDIMTFAADMPTVAKSDGTFYYVDLQFYVARIGAHLAWNGTYASLPAGSYNIWDGGILRAYTNGKRWRLPWTAMFSGGLSQSFVAWWGAARYETGTTSGASAPARVLMDAFGSHGVLSSASTPASWRGSLGSEDIDILLIEDN